MKNYNIQETVDVVPENDCPVKECSSAIFVNHSKIEWAYLGRFTDGGCCPTDMENADVPLSSEAL
jgi:hypothetical protein